jgi:glycosyltransferase involved in cell wall biosynthesis
MKPLINIIVPIYNVDSYLRRCVDSLLSQTYKNIRVILIDDGSTDTCPILCDEYDNLDDRVISFHRKNGGLSAARNTGLDYLFSESPQDSALVSFVDSDDWVEPDFIEFLYTLLIDNNAQIAQCGHLISYSDTCEEQKASSQYTQVLNRVDAIESLCRNGVWDVTTWNKLYRLELFQSIRFPIGSSYEDTATSYLLASSVDTVAVNMAPKYHYTQRYTSIANGNTWKSSKFDLITAGDQMANWVDIHHPNLSTAAMEKRVFVRLSTLSQMVNCNYSNKREINKIRQFIIKNAKTILLDPQAQNRDKIGILALMPGWLCYRMLWKTYYAIKRHRRAK